MTMVGQVARALEDELSSDELLLEHLARIAIRSLRNPSEGMLLKAGHPEAHRIWQAMIDEAAR